MSSTVKADFAEVATVDLRAAPGVVATGAPVVVDGETLVALVGGVLSYRPDKCSALVIASGEIVVAIRPLYQGNGESANGGGHTPGGKQGRKGASPKSKVQSRKSKVESAYPEGFPIRSGMRMGDCSSIRHCERRVWRREAIT